MLQMNATDRVMSFLVKDWIVSGKTYKFQYPTVYGFLPFRKFLETQLALSHETGI